MHSKLLSPVLKLFSNIAVFCFSYKSIEAVKATLKAGEALNSKQVPIQIKLAATPLFVLTSLSVHKQKVIETLTEASGII
jgi:translation initiation factor 2 subunit 1